MKLETTREYVEAWLESKRLELGVATIEINRCGYSEETRYTIHTKCGECRCLESWDGIVQFMKELDPIELAQLRIDEANAEIEKSMAIIAEIKGDAK